MPLNSRIIPHRPGRDVDLVEDIGLVGRDDRDAEHLAKAGGEDEQPEQRPDQRGDEALALVQEAQPFAHQDALEADEIVGDGRRRGASRQHTGSALSAGESAALMRDPPAGTAAFSSRSASGRPRRCLPSGRSITFGNRLRDRMRPSDEHDDVSLASISSIRWVAQKHADAFGRHQLPDRGRIAARDWTSSPTVASSSSSSGGRWSSARAISMRRIWPPDRLRALSFSRPAMPTVSSSASIRRRASLAPMPCRAAW